MGVLFMLPALPSEAAGWMLRMLDSIDTDLSVLAVWNAGDAADWRRVCPVASLIRPRSRVDRVRSRLGLPTHNTTRHILQSLVNRADVSAVLCQYGEFACHFLDVWRETTKPLFVHFHGYDASFDMRHDDDPARLYHPKGYVGRVRALSKRATFIANSMCMRDRLLAAGVGPSSVVVKYLGAPVLPSRTHKGTQDLTILSVGRLVDVKSPDRTIAAFEVACGKGLSGRLVMVGDGPLKPMCELLRSRSRWKARIQLTGALSAENVRELMCEADVYTQHNIEGEVSKQSEALGMSVLEAMGAGLPVVATRHGGVQETVVEGETGVLVEPGDVQAHADALLRLASTPSLRQRLGDAGRERVAQHFSIELERKQLRHLLGLV